MSENGHAPQRWLRTDTVLAVVADWTGLSADILTNAKKGRFTAREERARRLLWAVMREALGMSYTELGRFADRNHTSILRSLQNYPPDAAEVAALVAMVRDGARR